MLVLSAFHGINPAKAQTGWNYPGYDGAASVIHASAAGIDSSWTEDFENWNSNGWVISYSSNNGATWAIVNDNNAHSPTHDMLVSCNTYATQSEIYNTFPLSTYANITLYIKFLALNWGSTDMELVQLQGASAPNAWRSSADAVVTNTYGYPLWALENL